MIPGYTHLRVERSQGLDWVTLDRPQQLNALNRVMTAEIGDYFRRLADSRATRVVVLQGAGRAFCAGLDLKEGPDTGPDGGSGATALLIRQRRYSELVLAMRRAPQPIVALLRGAVCGAGFGLALAADIRIAADSARMNAAGLRIGLSGTDLGMSYFLPRMVGASVSAELLLTGRFIDAARAERVGLVSEVVADDALDEAGRRIAAEMLRAAPLGLRLTKDSLRCGLEAGSLDDAISVEDRNQVMCNQTGDFQEGMRSFVEKRPPRFSDA
jgi:enoyl-CoA hydratase